MAGVADLIHQLEQLVKAKDWRGAHEAALALWQYHDYQGEITRVNARTGYVSALFKVADLFQYVGYSPYQALAPLKRAYALDDGRPMKGANHSFKELAAHKLGNLYEEARCPHSAAAWFRRALDLAEDAGVVKNVLRNLHYLAGNLETLVLFDEAGRCYDRTLEMLSSAPVRDYLPWLVPAAMYQIHHGDPARGETVMHSLIADTIGRSVPPSAGEDPLEVWFLAALRALGMHYIATGRPQEALELARMIGEKAGRFDEPEWARDAGHGLTARTLVQLGRLDDALVELAQVLDVENAPYRGGSYGQPLETAELWADIARIHAARQHFETAVDAYSMLAYHLGRYIADTSTAQTTRLRFHWLQQQALIVHEMASVWLTIPDEKTRRDCQVTVANSLLQLKANIFIAMEVHKLDSLKYSTGESLFQANRRFAAAARTMLAAPDDPEAMLELEDTIFQRDEFETSLLTGDMIPGIAGIFEFDFRKSQALGDDDLLLDYSLISYRPPSNGMAGTPQGRRYVGVRLAKGDLRVIDLGEAEPIDALCQPFIQTLAAPPVPGTFSGAPQEIRQLRPVASPVVPKVDVDRLSEAVYDHIVAPFEPLADSLLLSPDGILAALPFHALIHEGRYLVEDRDVVYCHSLLQRESLSRRQLSPGRRAVPSITRSALLLGDPEYTTGDLPALPGTALEVEQVADVLGTVTFRNGGKVFEDVHVHTGREASVMNLLSVPWPRVLHIAAHGTFDESQTRMFIDQPVTPGASYRRWEEMGTQPLTALDKALLHSTIILANDPASIGDPAGGAVLTAMELASLNLIGCHVVVLSACESGGGATAYGAGVLGFQYSVLATYAKAGLLSLWKVLDRETASFMVDFYRNFLDTHEVRDGYLNTVRAHCRRNGQRIHPYYWAAFVLLDQDYYHPVF